MSEGGEGVKVSRRFALRAGLAAGVGAAAVALGISRLPNKDSENFKYAVKAEQGSVKN